MPQIGWYRIDSSQTTNGDNAQGIHTSTFQPRQCPFLQDLTSARAANHPIHHLVHFEDESTWRESPPYKYIKILSCYSQTYLTSYACLGSLRLLPLSSPALLQLLVPPLQLPMLAGNPDPPASTCALCQSGSQFSHLFLLSTSLGINGSGCPPGSAIYTLSCPFLFYSIARSSLTFFSRTLSR